MRNVLPAVIFLCVATGAVAEEDFQREVVARSINYRLCVEQYANSHAGPGASPTEVAAAADFRCQKEFAELRRYYQNHIIDTFLIDESTPKRKEVTSRARAYLMNQMSQNLAEVQSLAKSEAAAIVIDRRN